MCVPSRADGHFPPLAGKCYMGDFHGYCALLNKT